MILMGISGIAKELVASQEGLYCMILMGISGIAK